MMNVLNFPLFFTDNRESIHEFVRAERKSLIFIVWEYEQDKNRENFRLG